MGIIIKMELFGSNKYELKESCEYESKNVPYLHSIEILSDPILIVHF